MIDLNIYNWSLEFQPAHSWNHIEKNKKSQKTIDIAVKIAPFSQPT